MLETLETQLSQHLAYLAHMLGPRPAGSPQNSAAADYVHRTFASAGLDVSEQTFPATEWQDNESSLTIDGVAWPVAANAFSRPCDVRAPTLVVTTIAELKQANLHGRVAILCGELTQSPLTPKGLTIYNSERDQHIISLIEAKQPDGVITVNMHPPYADRLIEDPDFLVPSATVSARVGLQLVRSEGQMIHLRLDTAQSPTIGRNVIGRKAGRRPNRILVCAHYDTKIATPGAFDNASGTIVLLGLAQLLGQANLDLGLELVAFGDEEYSDRSDLAYQNAFGDTLESIVIAIGVDSVGEYLGATTVTVMSNSDALQERIDSFISPHADMIWTEPWIQSNHGLFAWRGVPTMAITSYLAGIRHLAHQPDDTTDWISPAKLARVTTWLADVICALQSETPTWSRPPQTALEH